MVLATPSPLALRAMRSSLLQRAKSSTTGITTSRFTSTFTRSTIRPDSRFQHAHISPINHHPQARPFSTTPHKSTTLNQLRKQPRQQKKARRPISPAMHLRPEMKGVCLKVGITKPKKPNSGLRKTAKIRLSNGKIISAYIPGEGHNVQQHSVVMVRGGRSQDCPGVRYHLVRGALDLGGVPSRVNARSKYGTKKPKAAVI